MKQHRNKRVLKEVRRAKLRGSLFFMIKRALSDLKRDRIYDDFWMAYSKDWTPFEEIRDEDERR